MKYAAKGCLNICFTFEIKELSLSAQVRPNTLAPALAMLHTSSEFSLDGYRTALGIPQLVRAHPSVLSLHCGVPALR